jgi:hypothetical protein
MDNDTILSGEKQSEKGATLKRPAPTITALRVASFFMIFPPLVLHVIPSLEATSRQAGRCHRCHKPTSRAVKNSNI